MRSQKECQARPQKPRVISSSGVTGLCVALGRPHPASGPQSLPPPLAWERKGSKDPYHRDILAFHSNLPASFLGIRGAISLGPQLYEPSVLNQSSDRAGLNQNYRAVGGNVYELFASISAFVFPNRAVGISLHSQWVERFRFRKGEELCKVIRVQGVRSVGGLTLLEPWQWHRHVTL